MTEPIDKIEKVGRALAEEKSFRRNVLDRLRGISRDVSAVERMIVDDYARADVERRQAPR